MDAITHREVLNANKSFYDRMFDTYKRSEYYAYQSNIVDDVKKNIEYCARNLSRRDVIVDIGCGSGFLSSLAKEYFANGMGIDISGEQLRLYQKSVPGYCPLLGDITQMGLKGESVDMVASYSVLHHILDYHIVLHEMTRILKKGGILYTDFEPARDFHKKIKFLIDLRKKFIDKDPSGLDIEKIAEFHQNYSTGIDKAGLLSHLSKNFRILRVGARFPEYKFPQSFFTLGCKFIYRLTNQKFDPYFWIIAKKKL